MEKNKKRIQTAKKCRSPQRLESPFTWLSEVEWLRLPEQLRDSMDVARGFEFHRNHPRYTEEAIANELDVSTHLVKKVSCGIKRII